MKVFAFLLASLFTFQATTPALCMSTCMLESAAGSSCCLIEESDDCCTMDEATCNLAEEQSCCATEEMPSCAPGEEDRSTEDNTHQLPCNSCNIPCCSAPLCCFFFQEITDLDFSVVPVLTAGKLPSNNGIPIEGYLDECFQPPETIS